MPQKKIDKVAKALKKASNTHAKQAKTLESIKLKKGGPAKKDNIPDNVANPSLYRKAKAKAKVAGADEKLGMKMRIINTKEKKEDVLDAVNSALGALNNFLSGMEKNYC